MYGRPRTRRPSADDVQRAWKEVASTEADAQVRAASAGGANGELGRRHDRAPRLEPLNVPSRRVAAAEAQA